MTTNLKSQTQVNYPLCTGQSSNHTTSGVTDPVQTEENPENTNRNTDSSKTGLSESVIQLDLIRDSQGDSLQPKLAQQDRGDSSQEQGNPKQEQRNFLKEQGSPQQEFPQESPKLENNSKFLQTYYVNICTFPFSFVS